MDRIQHALKMIEELKAESDEKGKFEIVHEEEKFTGPRFGTFKRGDKTQKEDDVIVPDRKIRFKANW